MDVVFYGSLVALALVDSTSFGTLLVPVWLLLHPGPVRPARVLVFLATVAGFYFGVGLALALGADALMPRVSAMLEIRIVSWVQLVVGVALFFLSFRLGGKRRPRATTGRLVRWRERAVGAAGSDPGTSGRAATAMVGLALTAGAVELATMLPYLAAIGLITAADLPLGVVAVVMAGYCLVMVTPALILLGLRLVVGPRIEPGLTMISNWMTNNDALAWIVGIVGALLARDAVVRLGLLG